MDLIGILKKNKLRISEKPSEMHANQGISGNTELMH